MCRMMGIIGKAPLPAQETLEAFQLLCRKGQVKPTMQPGHLDGWGISGYHSERAVYFERRAESAAVNPAFFRTAGARIERSDSEVLVAHLRKASEGAPHMGNTHPFHYRDWAFAHNGTVFGAAASLSLVEATPQGETDSERLMLWILEHVLNERDVTVALVNLLKQSRETLVFTSLTFLLTNGKTLWAYRDYGEKRLEKGESLQDREKYYTLYFARIKNAAVVCSEALTSLPALWEPIAQRHLAVFSPESYAPALFKV